MFDLFSFQSVDHDPFSEAGSKNSSAKKTPDPHAEPAPTPSRISPAVRDPMLQQMDDYFNYLTALRIPPNVAAKMTTTPMQEEWEASRMQHPMGENIPPESPFEGDNVAPDSGAKNLWNAFRTRNWVPRQYWSLPVDRINALAPPEEGENPIHGLGGRSPTPSEDLIDTGNPLRPGLPAPLHSQIEDILSQHATGTISPKEVHKMMPEGYSVKLRGSKLPYEVLDPAGNYHYIRP